MFKEIPGYNGYFINESGIIIDQSNNLIRTAANNQVQLYATINSNIEFIDSLVARTFLANQDEFKFINHIDDDKLNCHLSNIRWSEEEPCTYNIDSRSHRKYSNSINLYEVYNDEINDSVICQGRGEVASLIQYEEISLKNMVGNGRKITLGPYRGYQIRRLTGRGK